MEYPLDRRYLVEKIKHDVYEDTIGKLRRSVSKTKHMDHSSQR